MLTSSANALLGEWEAEGHPLLNKRRAQDTRWIVGAAFQFADDTELKLDRHAIEALETQFYHWRREIEQAISRHEARRRLTRVLQSLNEQPGVTAVLPPHPVRPHRETAMPRRGATLVEAHQVMALDRQLLHWARQHQHHDSWLFVLAVRLVTRLGMGEAVLLGTLARLTRAHVTEGWLLLPSMPDETLADGAHYRLQLPSALWIPLRAILSRSPQGSAQWLLPPNNHSELTTRTQREGNLRSRLNAMATQCLRDLAAKSDTSLATPRRSWSQIARAGRHVPVLRGTPPLWAGLLQRYPLPSDTPMPLLDDSTAHRYETGESHGRIDAQQPLPELPTLGDTTQAAGVHTLDLSHLPPDWPRQIKRRLHQFIREAARLTPNKKVHTDRYAKPLQQLLVDYEASIVDLIGHHGSYAQWLLHWLYHLLRIEKNTLSTAHTHLSRITPLTIVRHVASLDLSDWNNELVEELQADTLTEQQWKPSTRQAFTRAFGQFIQFCQLHGMLEDVTPPQNEQKKNVSTLRTRILTPGHFHNLWHGLTHTVLSGERGQLLGLVIALGFYGGLRASEVRGLTLKDIAIGEDRGQQTCWVEILDGKSSAARRRIALHVMAPPSVVNSLGAWVHYRRNSCRTTDRLSEIALFGPEGNPAAYTRQSLITPVIAWMRRIMGDGVDFHGLRHAAVSWTLLRLHAAQRPGFADTLFHRHHWMFSDEALEALRVHFCGAEGEDAITRGTLLLRVVKWVGHRNPETLLQHYVHTLGLIHSDILTCPVES
ncbi:hypothetical protein [Chromohalobacter sp. 48-RD10]|uniref:hypothetical protein n=1 Tax=Chromohalobacter sp. 48-RD10 TaxID=2994063 RepID=UPI00246892BE|nr:hypothetical protein [Chromohalobacter sp. 48-RD10]